MEENPGLQQELDEIIQGVGAVDMGSKNILIKTFHCHAVRIKGAEQKAVSNVLGVVCFLGAGVVLSSLDIDLASDMREFKVKGNCAPEMMDATSCIPAQHIFSHNPMIFESLKQAVQIELDDMETDEYNNPTFGGVGKLPMKSKEAEPLLLYKLYLAREKTAEEKAKGEVDDCWQIHRIFISGAHARGTVPAYVAICYFLEDIPQKRSAKKNISRLLPEYSTGGSAPQAFQFPPSPQLPGPPETPNAKRRREEAEAAAMDTGNNNNPMPDDPTSGGQFFFRRR
jgi:hypothetical protein